MVIDWLGFGFEPLLVEGKWEATPCNPSGHRVFLKTREPKTNPMGNAPPSTRKPGLGTEAACLVALLGLAAVRLNRWRTSASASFQAGNGGALVMGGATLFGRVVVSVFILNIFVFSSGSSQHVAVFSFWGGRGGGGGGTPETSKLE